MRVVNFDRIDGGGFDPREYTPIGILYSNNRSAVGLETIYSVTGEGFIDLATFNISGWVGAGYVQLIIDGVTYQFNFTTTSGNQTTYASYAFGFASNDVVTCSDSGQRVPSPSNASVGTSIFPSVIFDPATLTYTDVSAMSQLPIFFNSSVVLKAYYNSAGKAAVRGGLKI